MGGLENGRGAWFQESQTREFLEKALIGGSFRRRTTTFRLFFLVVCFGCLFWLFVLVVCFGCLFWCLDIIE
jgi:hypothetical protein